MRATAGYTLVELLIAVTVFAVLASTAYVALDGLSRAALVQRERAGELAALQLAVARLDADLRQIVSRPVRGANDVIEPALIGERRALNATRAGWANPADHPRSQLQRYAWTFDGAELSRLYWPVTDRLAGSQPLVEPVLADLRELGFRYLDASGVWHDQWPPVRAAASEALPRAIEVELVHIRHGRIRRLLVLAP